MQDLAETDAAVRLEDGTPFARWRASGGQWILAAGAAGEDVAKAWRRPAKNGGRWACAVVLGSLASLPCAAARPAGHASAAEAKQAVGAWLAGLGMTAAEWSGLRTGRILAQAGGTLAAAMQEAAGGWTEAWEPDPSVVEMLPGSTVVQGTKAALEEALPWLRLAPTWKDGSRLRVEEGTERHKGTWVVEGSRTALAAMDMAAADLAASGQFPTLRLDTRAYLLPSMDAFGAWRTEAGAVAAYAAGLEDFMPLEDPDRQVRRASGGMLLRPREPDPTGLLRLWTALEGPVDLADGPWGRGVHGWLANLRSLEMGRCVLAKPEPAGGHTVLVVRHGRTRRFDDVRGDGTYASREDVDLATADPALAQALLAAIRQDTADRRRMWGDLHDQGEDEDEWFRLEMPWGPQAREHLARLLALTQGPPDADLLARAGEASGLPPEHPAWRIRLMRELLSHAARRDGDAAQAAADIAEGNGFAPGRAEYAPARGLASLPQLLEWAVTNRESLADGCTHARAEDDGTVTVLDADGEPLDVDNIRDTGPMLQPCGTGGFCAPWAWCGGGAGSGPADFDECIPF